MAHSIVDERVGVQVKLWNALRTRVIHECNWGDYEEVLYRVFIYLYTEYSLGPLGLKLIPFSRQSVHSDMCRKSSGRLAVLGCHYILPDLVIFPASECHRTLATTKLYCLVTEACVWEQLFHSRYMKVEELEVEPTDCQLQFWWPNHYTIATLWSINWY